MTSPRTKAVEDRRKHARLPRKATLITSCLAVCLAQIALAMPATLNGLFQQSLHPVGSQLTWISDAFLLPVTVLELTFGVLGDLFGRKRLLVGGTALLAVGEVVAATAGDIPQLWTGQLLGGLGAAALFPTTLAMVAAGTHTPRDRARGIAVWTASLSTGGFVAPVLGGISGTYGSWKLSFVIVAALAVITALVCWLLAEDSSSPEGRSLDWGGQITILIGLFALLYAVIQGPTDGWGSPSVIGSFVVAAVFLVLFVLAEHRARSPLLRLGLFRNRAFTIVSVITVVGMFSFLGTAYATSIRIGVIQHQSPLRTSMAFVLLGGFSLVLTPLISRLLERANPRWLLSGGLLLMATGDFWMATLDIRETSLGAHLAPLGLAGIGYAFSIASVTAVAVNTVPVRYTGMASASTSLLRDFGFTLGPALIGAVALGQAASAFRSGLSASSLPPATQAAATEVARAGGPLAVNSLPPDSAPGQAVSLARDALGQGYSLGYVVCGTAALMACLLAVSALRGDRKNAPSPQESSAAGTPATTAPEPL
ncbi:MFS transporter [Streptomyces platensis]|uniref:MFS transporter n=1 Tax=Streptomyces platensis TaxID=58346 RepID=A0AAE6NN94_STRPT|nr:MFS transporter [Streptomyces platensis]OSY48202.1 Multidrug resistance protein stp [Streptomyces platensis]QEV56144.1 MFS transporter [Streptomyces platensis]